MFEDIIKQLENIKKRLGIVELKETPVLTVEEQDGAPSVTGVNKIKFDNGTVTDDGNGVVSVTNSGGGGGAISWRPDLPPETLGDYDDEFDSASGTIDGRTTTSGTWALWDSGSVLADDYVDEFGAGFEHGGSVGWKLAGAFQDYNGDLSGYSLYTRVSLQVDITGSSEEYFAGLLLGEDLTNNPSTSACIAYGIHFSTGTYNTKLIAALFDDYQTLNTSYISGYTGLIPIHYVYLRIRNVFGDGDLAFDFSWDGLGWMGLDTVARPWIPQQFGIVVNNKGTPNAVSIFSFFRHTTFSAADVLSVVLYGQRG